MVKPALKFTTSWDDGTLDDLRIAELLKSRGLPGTFYIPSLGELLAPRIAELAKDFNIGGHTVSHCEDLKRLDDDDLMYEIQANKYHLENAIGRPVTSFAYPSGRYDERVIEAVKKAGFNEARTTLVLKTEARNPWQTDTTIHTFPRREYKSKPWDQVGKLYAKLASDTDGYFHLWGHATDLNNFNDWARLDLFLEWINQNFIIQSV